MRASSHSFFRKGYNKGKYCTMHTINGNKYCDLCMRRIDPQKEYSDINTTIKSRSKFYKRVLFQCFLLKYVK